jgi:hypothetical protein
MIGGASINLASNVEPEEALRQAFVLILRRWHSAIVENAATGEVLPIAVPLDAFADLQEIMVYRDAEARHTWETLGASPSNANTMIHVIASATSVTLVVDDPHDPVTQEIAQGVRIFLANDIFHIPAEVAA